ncbi:hypothetical protein H9649_01470 [Sporosarcina sp. Sa2YVA2]|uniref:DUF4825 domain-containing protein n=1 Tax=Sporosarcina quadrami TaxID=2762234 RepID=A0ABR8U630_9BACL|nr:hypothetical protein [Sporosarcina quadrami]MBD7983235.1 hypothetical protein [Sporosarcina quadrami]
MKKTFIVTILFVTALVLAACGGYTPHNNWVLEKDRLDENSEMENFVISLQNNPHKRGFKVFTISEGRKMVGVLTGDAEKSLN